MSSDSDRQNQIISEQVCSRLRLLFQLTLPAKSPPIVGPVRIGSRSGCEGGLQIWKELPIQVYYHLR